MSHATILTRTALILITAVLLPVVGIGPVYAQQQSFVVNSTNDRADDNPGDGVCHTGETIPGDGEGNVAECTFRAALQEANEWSTTASELHEVTFSSLLDGEFEAITNSNDLGTFPYIEKPMLIDGYSAAAYDETANPENPVIILQGSELSGDVWGLLVTAGGSGSIIRGLAIYEYSYYGIVTDVGSENVTVQGCHIGIEAGGETARPNDFGIYLFGDNHIIGQELSGTIGSSYTGRGNVISGNGSHGVYIEGANNVVRGNLIGTNYTGDAVVGNEGHGVYVSSNAGAGNYIGTCTTTLTTTCSRNVISGNGEAGVFLNADDQHVVGNWIGTNESGDDLGNSGTGISVGGGSGNAITGNTVRYSGEDGVDLQSAGTTLIDNTITENGTPGESWGGVRVGAAAKIGDPDSGDGNVIGSNEAFGMRVEHSSGVVQIQGNYIGTNADGDDLGNSRFGLLLVQAGDVEIGNTEAWDGDEAANVVAFTKFDQGVGGEGIYISQTDGAHVYGNYIGTNAEGDDLGNAAHGIRISTGAEARDNRIGYHAGASITDPLPVDGGLGNVIAHNGGNGVHIRPTTSGETDLTGNSVRGNSIYTNGGAGIYLGPDGDEVDIGGGDMGPNNMQNFPEFDEAGTEYNEATGEIEYRYRVRTNVDNAAYPLKIDFYLADEGNAQGKTYLGTDEYPEANATDWRAGSFEPPSGVDVSSSDMIVATATDTEGNTSQFTPVAQPLPVELVEFEATQQDGAVVLTWETASETDNSGFEVQRKAEADGAATFETLAFVEGAGTTSEQQTYRHRVDDVEMGTYRFRLKQIDLDGTATYSDEVEVAIAMTEHFVFEAPYPNPARGQATLRFAVRESQSVTIVLYNTLGQRVRTLYDGTPAAETTETLTVNGSKLSSGLYFVRLHGKSFSTTETVTFVK